MGKKRSWYDHSNVKQDVKAGVKEALHEENNGSTIRNAVKDGVAAALQEQEDAKRSQENAKQEAEKAQRQLRPKDYVVSGSKEEEVYLDDLRTNIKMAEVNYMDFAEKHAELTKDGLLDTQMDMMSHYYYQFMMLQCVEPLSKGVNAESVVQAVGMYVGMAAVNKSFRKECHRSVQNAIYPVVERMAEKNGPDSAAARWRDKIIKEQNNGRMPWNPKSAALAEIGMMKRAYNDMREPGANVDAITAHLEKGREVLRAQLQADGHSVDEMDMNSRLIIGQIMEKNPEFAAMFNETAYQGVGRADYRTVQETIQTPNGPELRTKQVWSGEFNDANGKPYTGRFTPRKPAAKDFHDANMTNLFETTFAQCNTPDEFKKAAMDNARDSVIWAGMYRDDCCKTDEEALDFLNTKFANAKDKWVKDHSGMQGQRQTPPQSDRGKQAEETFEDVLRKDGQVIDAQFTN